MKNKTLISMLLLCSIPQIQAMGFKPRSPSQIERDREKNNKNMVIHYIKKHDPYGLENFLQRSNFLMPEELKDAAYNEHTQQEQYAQYPTNVRRVLSTISCIGCIFASSTILFFNTKNLLPPFFLSHDVYTYTAGMFGMLAVKWGLDTITNSWARQVHQKSCLVYERINNRWLARKDREPVPQSKVQRTNTAPATIPIHEAPPPEEG